MDKIQIFTDGGARGNPGPAAIGCVIRHGSGSTGQGPGASDQPPPAGRSDIIWEYGEYIGTTTNNQAEYRALIRALEEALARGYRQVQCFLDSELLVKQIKREYRVKEPTLQPLFVRVYNLIQKFSSIDFFHIPREKNKHADRMVNKALDAGAEGGPR